MTAMRYKDFVWPNNPSSYQLSCKRQTVAHKVPEKEILMQDMGLGETVMTGEGEFFGPQAYVQFQKLIEVFQTDGAGVLVHPVWKSANAYFTKLELRQEPRKNYVAYSFEFREGGSEAQSVLKEQSTTSSTSAKSASNSQKSYYTVKAGDTLWAISRSYQMSLQALLKLNPEISNPNYIVVGQKVRIK